MHKVGVPTPNLLPIHLHSPESGTVTSCALFVEVADAAASVQRNRKKGVRKGNYFVAVARHPFFLEVAGESSR